MAAAELYEKLQQGHHRTQEGKRRRIDGDMSKLRFAEDALLVLDNNGLRGEEVSYGPYFNASEAQAAVLTVLSGGTPARAATLVETNVPARVSAPCWLVDRAHDYCL